MNRRRNSLAASPLLIGAVTTLIVLVAVYLSYNANNGLPFTPTYDIKVVLPSGSELQSSNQVRIGGTRIGTVSSLVPHQDPATGRVTAIASLKLEKSVEPLPADTRAIVQSASSIGLKYLALERGTSSATIKQGGTIPLSQTREPVDIDELFNMFDKKTRIASQINLINFGNGLAGRGVGLNETIHTLVPLVKSGEPVLRNLASPKTDLRGFFIALERAASEVAPVATSQAAFYRDLDTFFTAWAGVSPSLEQTIQGGPAALEQAIHSLPYQAPFMEKGTEFMRLLRPSAKSLIVAAPQLGHAFAVGAVNLRAANELNRRLTTSLKALQSFAQNPVVALGLEDLTQTAQAGNPIAAGLAPAQTQCNYFTLFFRNLSSALSSSNGVGTLFRAQALLSPLGPNNQGGPSSAPASGPTTMLTENLVNGHPTTPPTYKEVPATINGNFLHANPYPNVSGPGQPRVCEAGNETYLPGRTVVGNLPTGNIGNGREVTKREAGLPTGATSSQASGSTTTTKTQGKQG
jgi:ABC-type transporter Mla subunit MlaD